MLTAKELKALDRLTGKLDNVRKSLRGEERALFDQIMASATFEANQDEVNAHYLRGPKPQKTDYLRGAEVVAHSQTAAVASSKLASAEVVAHAMQEGAVATLTLGVLKNTLKVTLK